MISEPDWHDRLPAMSPCHATTIAPAVRDRRRWRIRLSALLLLPVAFAIAFVAITRWTRVSREERMKLEDEWILRPTTTKFWPEDGEWVHAGDPVLKVASFRASPGAFASEPRCTMLVDAWGKVQERVHVTWDRWDKEYPLRPESSDTLPAFLAKLPPSDPAATPADCLYIAYPQWGRWVVRKYRRSAAPKEALAVSSALHAEAAADGE
ncbi:MAG TPA: hypothetical protein VGH33_19350 [Isosphaeraceae bacterium]|jgi:hypothetical protein